jgi:subtilase family serine protease
VTAGLCALAAAALTQGSALASTATPVPSDGNVSALPGAAPTGTTPGSTPETISFIFRARNAAQLAQAAQQPVSAPLSVSQFAGTYGRTPDEISALESYLGSYGITTSAYADRLDVVANGTASEFNRALGLNGQTNYYVPAQGGHGGRHGVPAQNPHGTTSKPSLPPSIASSLLAILGLSNYSPFTTPALHAPTASLGSSTAGPASSVSACESLTGLPDACNLPSDFASRYGLTGLQRSGANGQGETLGIVTLAAVDPGAPEYFWSHIADIPASNRTLTIDNVDGGPGAPNLGAGTGETDLDLEQSGSLAPGANIVAYQAPNTDPGFADAFYTAASQNAVDSLSASWGESETVVAAAVASDQETPTYELAFDQAFMEMAVQGQSTFVSAGDFGAYDAAGDLGTTNLSVDTPGDSPYVTVAGGTTLPWSATLTGSNGASAPVSVTRERAWGWDYLWPAIATVDGESEAAAAEANIGGGGGGYSAFEPQPPYQDISGSRNFSAVEYLTPTDVQDVSGIEAPTGWSFDPTPPVSHGSGSTRALPDVSADADPYTGYLLYAPSFASAGQPTLQGGWGGTSFVAPQLNGAAAVIDSSLGRRAGFWNPSIYPLAAGGKSPFSPLDQSGTSNDNLYYSGTPGTDYNPASGLGTPDLSALARDLQH